MSHWFRNPLVLIGTLVLVVVVLFVVDASTKRTPAIEPPTPVPAFVPQLEPTHGTANWWCLSAMKCWHTTDACDSDRRKVYANGGGDQQCAAVDVAACLEVERILTKERTRECYASIAYCKSAVQQWRNKEPDDVRITVECVAE